MYSNIYALYYACSDTVGRSGMLCAMMSTIERCKTERVVDVFQMVKALRVQKPGAVQTVVCSHLLIEIITSIYLPCIIIYPDSTRLCTFEQAHWNNNIHLFTLYYYNIP